MEAAETARREHVHHRFAVTLDPDPDAFAKRSTIEAIVRDHGGSRRERATRESAAVGRYASMEATDPTPQAFFRTNEFGKH